MMYTSIFTTGLVLSVYTCAVRMSIRVAFHDLLPHNTITATILHFELLAIFQTLVGDLTFQGTSIHHLLHTKVLRRVNQTCLTCGQGQWEGEGG